MTRLNQPPIIGITAYKRSDSGEYAILETYVNAVRRAGGIPILFPPGEAHPEQLLSAINGLVLTGGGDIDPQQYNGTAHATIYKIDPERDAFELSLAKHALHQQLPILGICRGMQILSVVSGSKLIPHVPDFFGNAIAHRVSQFQHTRHWVDLDPESRLGQAVGVTQMEVVSWHHQAVSIAPPGWRAIAHAPDGVIEALEHEHHPWAIAVQWHPEMSAATDPLQQQIFQAFIEAARSPEWMKAVG
jgi:putative glutamine amidotransferase